MTFALPGFDLDAFVAATLAEDLGEGGDITSEAVIPADARFRGVMDSRDAIVIAGLPIAEAFFRALDTEVRIERPCEDGQQVEAGTDLIRIAGRARALLTAERSALNVVQHLSGIATLTRAYVDAIAGTGAVLLDTRKTIPGLRALEKYATRMGGAQNHRMGLWDAAMIKDNHAAVAGGVEEAVRRAAAAGIVAGRVPTEASGGVTLETIRAKAETGVTYVSVGRITQSAPAADIGLDFAAA
jgi:nicotinate-nucleotide pyrophosphorylase (carboxylating)